MALIKCSKCGKEISDKASECIHCGCSMEIAKKQEIKKDEKIKEEKKESISSQEIEKLKQELEEEKIHNEKLKLEKEIIKEKNKGKNKLVIFINIIRYCLVGFCAIGVLVAISQGLSFSNFIFFLGMGISFLPEFYAKLFTKIKVSEKTKLIIQIALPIALLFVLGSAL